MKRCWLPVAVSLLALAGCGELPLAPIMPMEVLASMTPQQARATIESQLNGQISIPEQRIQYEVQGVEKAGHHYTFKGRARLVDLIQGTHQLYRVAGYLDTKTGDVTITETTPINGVAVSHDPQSLEARIVDALTASQVSIPEFTTTYRVRRVNAHKGPSRTLYLFEVLAVTTDFNRPGWKREAVATGTFNPQSGEITRMAWRILSEG